MPKRIIEPPKIVRAEFVAASATGDLPPPIGPEIAFAGRSNVGKSSLMNALTGRRGLVRTSSTPGCTRQVTLFEVDLKDGPRLTFTDLPGYGYARRSKEERTTWGTMIDDYLLGRPTLAAVMILVDVRRGLETEEHDLIEMLDSPPRTSRAPVKRVVVATKLDKLPLAAQRRALEKIAADVKAPVVGFSTREPSTRGEVWRALLKAAGFGASPPKE